MRPHLLNQYNIMCRKSGILTLSSISFNWSKFNTGFELKCAAKAEQLLIPILISYTSPTSLVSQIAGSSLFNILHLNEHKDRNKTMA